MFNSRIYFVLARYAWQEAFLVPQKLAAAIFVLCLRLGLLFSIYRIAYTVSGKEPQGIPFASAIWSIGAYFVLLSLMIRHIYKDISSDIQQGTIEVRLGKPYLYPLAVIAKRIGRGLPDMGLSLLVTGGILGWMVGAPPITLSIVWLIQILLLIVGGAILASLLYTLIGLSAFWLEDAEPVYWISDKFVMLLGGAYVPVLLFPGWLKALAIWSPFGGYMFAAQAFHPSFTQRWFELLGSQLMWIAILSVVVSMVFRAARRRVSINGG